jgi:hypothetical protein
MVDVPTGELLDGLGNFPRWIRCVRRGSLNTRVERKLLTKHKGARMKLEEIRIVMNTDFQHANNSVVSLFRGSGFGVTEVETGNLPNAARPGEPRRYASWDATLPELSFPIPATQSSEPSMLGCRFSIFELTASQTLLTVDVRLTSYPSLALLIPRVKSRMHEALTRLAADAQMLQAA